MGHASATFTMDIYIHKNETIMDGVKEKPKYRDQREKTKKKILFTSISCE